MQRNVYLRTTPPAEAVEAVWQALGSGLLKTEMVPAQEAAGRVTAAPVFARASSPASHAAAMDGVAVDAKATFGAREGRPLTLGPDQFGWVNTGHPLPPFADAVIMIENVLKRDDGGIDIEAPAFPWQHVRRLGEDIVATELLLPQNRLLTPYDVGALLSGGVWEVPVWEKIRLVVIPTGDEVLDFTTRPEPGPGQVVESNSMLLSALAAGWGCLPERKAPVPDQPEALAQAVAEALAGPAHVVVLCAGSSAGSKDFTRSVFERFGEIVVHGVAIMPGKPSILGVARDSGKLLVGAPGYPVSAVVCFEELVAPLLHRLMRKPLPARRKVPARLTRKFPSRLGMEEVVRLAAGRVGEAVVATPLARGAGMISTLTRAQALMRVPPDAEGVEENAEIQAELLVGEEALDRMLVVIGSHDNAVDLLANELMGLPRSFGLTSSHVGSMGGLTALKNGSAHLAGAHLFDPATGDYNFPFLAKYLPDLELTVVNLAIRHQGLIVAPGNPKGVRSALDLARPDVTFINRQRGAGTRILLDWHLDQAGVSPDQVRGYAHEEFTHMAVAANVLTGAADAGLGIFAAAKALGLDFAPLAQERYDLLVPNRFLDDPRVLAALAVIRTSAFQDKLKALGGYETTLTGQLMRPGQGLQA